MPHKYLMSEFEDFARTAANAEALMAYVSDRIHKHIPRYNWVGFYLIDPNDSGAMVLGPYTGSFTPNPRILLRQGLCGSAAVNGRVAVADNVAEDARYIQASDLVKSQISVPVLCGRQTVAVFNVESYFMAAFKLPVERQFVESCAKVVGRCYERARFGVLVNA
jgi:L-methionine (R)-S-oxide reductase